jgi:hypothetical protein
VWDHAWTAAPAAGRRAVLRPRPLTSAREAAFERTDGGRAGRPARRRMHATAASSRPARRGGAPPPARPPARPLRRPRARPAATGPRRPRALPQARPQDAARRVLRYHPQLCGHLDAGAPSSLPCPGAGAPAPRRCRPAACAPAVWPGPAPSRHATPPISRRVHPPHATQSTTCPSASAPTSRRRASSSTPAAAPSTVRPTTPRPRPPPRTARSRATSGERRAGPRAPAPPWPRAAGRGLVRTAEDGQACSRGRQARHCCSPSPRSTPRAPSTPPPRPRRYGSGPQGPITFYSDSMSLAATPLGSAAAGPIDIKAFKWIAGFTPPNATGASLIGWSPPGARAGASSVGRGPAGAPAAAAAKGGGRRAEGGAAAGPVPARRLRPIAPHAPRTAVPPPQTSQNARLEPARGAHHRPRPHRRLAGARRAPGLAPAAAGPAAM